MRYFKVVLVNSVTGSVQSDFVHAAETPANCGVGTAGTRIDFLGRLPARVESPSGPVTLLITPD